MANKGSIAEGIKERNILGILGTAFQKLAFNAANRLIVEATLLSGTVTTVTTVTTCSTVTACTTVANLTNWGVQNAQNRSQMDSQLSYQAGLRRNLIVS